MNEAGRAMLARTVNHEIGGGLARPGELRPDAAGVRHELAVREPGPIGADARVETVGAAGVDVVGLAVDPLHVGTEAHAAGKIEGDVDAEPAVDGGGIDQAGKRRAAPATNGVPLREHEER